MRHTYSLFLVGALLIATAARAQEFDAKKYVPVYTLPAPEGWGIERIAFPIEFAPSIPYKGVEDLRFTPGWGFADNKEYWSYTFLWYLDGKPEITPEAEEKNLAAYYTGLIGRNIEQRKIPQEKLFPVKVTMKKVSVEKGDLHTYSGTIEMLDYMAQKPIMLNCIVHVRICPGKDNTFVFHQISPKPMADDVWKAFGKLWTGFDCDKKK
ncbi:MAG: hypothetical protein WDO15_05690 [Bacteroidota bacterium]